MGKTVEELDISHAFLVAEKTKFSMLIKDVLDKMDELCPGGPDHIVLFGIEVLTSVPSSGIVLKEYFAGLKLAILATTAFLQLEQELLSHSIFAIGAR